MSGPLSEVEVEATRREVARAVARLIEAWSPRPGFEWFASRSRYIVLRGTGSPLDDGIWHQRTHARRWPTPTRPGDLVLYPSGRFERRADGMVAEVWTPEPPQKVSRPRTLLGAIS